MKRVQSAQVFQAYSRLRAAEFAHLVTHLRESQAEQLDSLRRARAMDDVARIQGQLEVIDKILQYVAEGEDLARKLLK